MSHRPSEPRPAAAVFELLERVFPGIRQGAEELHRLGVPWGSVSTPFLSFEGGRPVSHVGLIELPLVVLGRAETVGTLHAVATYPEHRGRGHFRRVMEEVFAYAASRYESLILTTEHPEYFEPFGFRILEEHRFTLRLPASDTEGGRAGPDDPGTRQMDLRNPGDVALLHRLLETREPVSRVVGVVREKAVFCFNEGRRPLTYVPDLDAMICLEREGARLTLFDVVGSVLPALGELLARLPGPVNEVVFCFAPDRFTAAADAEPRVFDHDGPSTLMVRGPFAAEGEAFALPRSART